MGGDHPEDAGLLDIDLPGFCPAVYPRNQNQDSRTASLGPDACRTDRNPRRTLILLSAKSVPTITYAAVNDYFQSNQESRPPS
jgi:hypothetical protein